MYQTSKKQASVLATSMLVTDTSDKKVVRVLYIYYLDRFRKNQGQKGQEQVRALLDSGGKVNTMSPAFAWKLGFHI